MKTEADWALRQRPLDAVGWEQPRDDLVSGRPAAVEAAAKGRKSYKPEVMAAPEEEGPMRRKSVVAAAEEEHTPHEPPQVRRASKAIASPPSDPQSPSETQQAAKRRTSAVPELSLPRPERSAPPSSPIARPIPPNSETSRAADSSKLRRRSDGMSSPPVGTGRRASQGAVPSPSGGSPRRYDSKQQQQQEDEQEDAEGRAPAAAWSGQRGRRRRSTATVRPTQEADPDVVVEEEMGEAEDEEDRRPRGGQKAGRRRSSAYERPVQEVEQDVVVEEEEMEEVALVPRGRRRNRGSIGREH